MLNEKGMVNAMKYGIEWVKKSGQWGMFYCFSDEQLELSRNRSMMPHFTLNEFQCNCRRCENTVVFPKRNLPLLLQAIRGECEHPIEICGPFRCYRHNAETTGAAKDSRHLPEHADGVDIKCESLSVDELLAVVRHVKLELGIKGGIGVYSNRLHVDTRGHDAFWDVR